MSKNIKTKIVAAICSIILFAGAALELFPSISAMAWNSDSTAYDKSITVDDDGNWVVTFYDKARTSSIYYTTVGYTLTVDGTSYSSVQLYFDPTSVKSVTDSNGMITTQKTISAADVQAAFNAIDPTGALYAQYTSGDYSNIKLDGLMTITNGDSKTATYSEETHTYTYNIDYVDSWLYSLIGDDGVFDLSDETELANMIKAYGWSAAAIKSLLESHTNKNLYNSLLELLDELAQEAESETTNVSEPDEEEAVAIDHISGRNYPIYKTYNTSSEFNLGEGIPSGESFTNGVKADVWYGQYGWTKVEGSYNIPVTVTFTGTYWYWEWEGWGDGDDETGDETGQLVQKEYDWSQTYTFVITRDYEYYYLSYIDTYLLDNLVVQNGAFDSDKTYTSGITVDTYASHDSGETRTDNVNSVYIGSSDTSKHTIKPTASPTVNLGNVSPGGFDPTSYRSVAEEALGEVTVWNDYLSINGTVYMDDTKSAAKAPTPVDIAEADYARIQYENTQSVTIPTETRNGAYTTTLNSTYKSLRPALGRTKSFSSSGDNCILSGYEDNEPIIVHTPVISPVKIITDGTDSEDTQLIDKDGNSGDEWDSLDEKYWLKLDGTYTFEFQPYQWLQDMFHYSDDEMIQAFGEGVTDLKGYSEGVATTKFDKYVKWKRVKFPFDVCINGVYYEVGTEGSYTDETTGETYSYYDDETGQYYTKWIYLPISSSTTVDFYIPTWVDESTTTFRNAEGYYQIKYEVAAYNVIDQFDINNEDKKEENENAWGSDNEVEGSYSEDDSKYVATYTIAANVSGWIYDFQIVGSTNASIYDKETKEENEGQYYSQKYSFALNKEEKKSGTYNRLGTAEVRYTLDGVTTTSWDVRNTIALSKGRSQDYSDMGGLWKGQYFTFSVKTIANLSDANDYIVISPDFRYVDTNGNVYRNDDSDEDNDVQFYYSLSTGEKFYQFGTTDGDSLQFETYLGDEMFDGAFYDGRAESHGNNDLLYSAMSYYATQENPTYYYLNKVISNYNMETITLKDTLRLLTGNLEQLDGNLGKDPENLLSLGELQEYNGSAADTSNITNLDDQFHKSMQTWFGEYYIPSDFYVVTKEKLEDAIVPNNGSLDLDGDGDVDLDDYAVAHYTDETHSKVETGITTDAWIFENEGYVVINFDIDSYNASREHLTYEGGNSQGGMWYTESGGNIPDIETGGNPDLTIDGEAGDVAIIELEHSVQDKYSARILFIDR